MMQRRQRLGPPERGGVAILTLGVLIGAVGLLGILGAVGASFVAHAELQQAADIAVASVAAGHGDAPLERARNVAKANGATGVRASLTPDGAKVRIRVTRRAPRVFGVPAGTVLHAVAYAELPKLGFDGGPNPAGEYRGSLVTVDTARVCPRVAAAWRAMERAAAPSGIHLTATSGFRSYAEQAVLYASLGPRLAAPPGASRHHDATEIDAAVGPAGSPTHRWLGAHAPRFGFQQRYSWEPWHWGFVAGC